MFHDQHIALHYHWALLVIDTACAMPNAPIQWNLCFKSTAMRDHLSCTTTLQLYIFVFLIKKNTSYTRPPLTLYLWDCSQKAAFVSPLISWLPTLQSQCTPIEHCRESCTARLAVHYYPIFLIEKCNILPNNLRDKQRCASNFLYRVQWGSTKAEMYNHPISN